MRFEQNKSIEKFGEKIGFITGFFLFTTILYFLLSFLNKLPVSWTYVHIIIIVSLITLTGSVIKRLLK